VKQEEFMSAFMELVKNRYSVRGFQNKPVEEPLILKVLEAGRLAPSACNNQPWAFIVIRKDATKKKLAAVYERAWFVSAPVILALCCDHSLAWRRKDGRSYGEVDVAIAMDHITLAATEAGLGTCWIANFVPDQARQVLELPETIEPVVFTPLGYPVTAAAQKKRKPLNEIIHWEKYNGKYSD
jgi:nitroreductase